MTENIQFCFYATVEAADKKSNVYKFKWLQPVGAELYYELPLELKNPNSHRQIYAIQKVKTVLSSIKTRGAYRTFTLSLSPEIVALYIDDDGDVVYKDVYLQATMTPHMK